MDTLQWSESLSVGFQEVDDDHKKLVVMLNTLITAIQEKNSRSIIGKVLHELISYTSWHFRHEERLMQTYRFKGFLAHKGEHAELINQAGELQRKFTHEGVDLTQDVLEFLKTWLTNHILKTDREMGLFLSGKVGKGVGPG
ncbi:MAG: hemerythrin family protein [Magnetococcales bacterium]|nr:hemerythrin family protein [Magnetococcales bacterium]